MDAFERPDGKRGRVHTVTDASGTGYAGDSLGDPELKAHIVRVTCLSLRQQV